MTEDEMIGWHHCISNVALRICFEKIHSIYYKRKYTMQGSINRVPNERARLEFHTVFSETLVWRDAL